jgi:phospholipase C
MKPLLLGIFLVLSTAVWSQATIAAAAPSGEGRSTPIEHLVVLLQENHTFDNYFGTFPGADGIPDGTCMPVDPTSKNTSECIRPFHIGSNDVALGDLDHSAATQAMQYNGGRLDGFVSALNVRRQDGRLAMGYYDESDLPYYWFLARNYTLFDRFFSSAADGSAKNHMYAVAGSSLAIPPSKAAESAARRPTVNNAAPTIFDRLEERGVSWKFYVQNYDPKLTYRTVSQYSGDRASQVIWVPLLNIDRFIDDPKLSRHIVDLSEYYQDLQNGTLPAVSYIAPSGASEHPPGSIASGERAVRTLINALSRSGAWSSSAFLLTYDDWGGWYDHVSPPQIDADGYGFRVPALLISPFSRQGVINHTQLDFTSILRFIEDNYGLQPLAKRDASANSLNAAFDFEAAPRPPYFWSDNSAATVLKKSSRRALVYTAYGSGMALAGLVLIALLALRARGARKVDLFVTAGEQRGTR